MFKALLAHPLTRGLDLDDPRTTDLRRRIIRENRFLQQIFKEWYTHLASTLPEAPGEVLELGSGAGFFGEFIPDLITSERLISRHVDVVLDGERLPLHHGALRALVMVDVFHHLPQPRAFLREAARCVRPGGVLAMHEPWVTPWSRFIYTRLHHEPFEPEVGAWEFPSSGPLSGANSALPWMVFERDRTQFEREFPQWRILTIELNTPFRYLVSGGVSMRQLMPGWSFGAWRTLERLFQPAMGRLAMFARIVLRREPLGVGDVAT